MVVEKDVRYKLTIKEICSRFKIPHDKINTEDYEASVGMDTDNGVLTLYCLTEEGV